MISTPVSLAAVLTRRALTPSTRFLAEQKKEMRHDGSSLLYYFINLALACGI
jgi:hypothetical protein